MAETQPTPRNFRDYGGAETTIVLVPGLDGTALLFYRQIPLLAKRFNVVAFPLPDCAFRSMDDLVGDLHRLVSEVASQRVILFGESFGGALSMSFALEHPDMLAGLVVLNSFSYIHTRFRLRAAPVALRMFPWAAMPLVRRFTEHRLHSPHALEGDLLEFRERSKEIGRDGYIRRLEILAGYDIRDRLHDLQVPTLFLAGDRDQLVPSVAESRLMGELVPNATIRVLEGYGHICLINHDLNLLDTIEPWFDSVTADASPFASEGTANGLDVESSS